MTRLVELGRADMDPTRRELPGLGLYSAALAAQQAHAAAQYGDRTQALTKLRAAQTALDRQQRAGLSRRR